MTDGRRDPVEEGPGEDGAERERSAGDVPGIDDVPEVDARGRPCPMPVIELARAVEDVPPGTRVRLLADDPAARVDVPVWCRMQGQRLVASREDDGVWTFEVERTA